MRRTIALVSFVMVLLSMQSIASADTTVEFRSRLLRVTYTDVHESGFYTFENRTSKVVRFVCAWAVAADDFDAPFIYGWSARLRPLGDRTYGDSRPRDVDCAAARTWPRLPVLEFEGSATEFESDLLQVMWYSACAEENPNECNNTLIFVNRVHQLISVECSWTTGDGANAPSFTDYLAPYEMVNGGSAHPDPSSLDCTASIA